MQRPVVGVLLAGGAGTRMKTLTTVTNKHLLPVYDRPMLCWPIRTLLENDIDKIVVISSDPRGAVQGFLGSGQFYPKEFIPEGKRNPRFTGKYQDNPKGGIADALDQAADVTPENAIIVVILADNIFPCDMSHVVRRYLEEQSGKGARIHLCRVPDPERFGVAEIVDGKITRIVEKPKMREECPSDLAVTGLYIYDTRVFEIIKTLVPSGRGELEITDVNNAYREADDLSYEIVDSWTDAGEIESRIRADNMCGAYIKKMSVPEFVAHLQRDPIKRTGE